MNLAEFSIRKSTVTWFLTLLIAVGGVWAYGGLGKLEDPAFTIKTAVIVTPYPGASPLEVENEVTALIESAAQKLGETDKVRSLSKEGLSMVYVDIKPVYTARDLPQIWDELRRKVADAQASLPPGAGSSRVNDDYGDVFGVYYALTGDGYTYRELEDHADFLRRELLLVEGVANVEIAGIQAETIYAEVDRSRMAQLGIGIGEIFGLLQAQNAVAGAGSAEVGPERIRISPTGYFSSVDSLSSLLLRGGDDRSIRLGDLADITRGYIDPPLTAMRYNGKPALGIGISNVEGGNVIRIGEAVHSRIQELETRTPLGMELGLIYYQPDTVADSIRDFVTNLLEALAIVIGILLIFMGFRSGLLIGIILLLTILATFIAMKIMGIDLHSISLGALIIALGMLVDNAIVVADGILVRMQEGMDGPSAAVEVVKQTQAPLLGATIIAAIAFAPIGLSPDSTGEFCRSLFQVVSISLLLSWILAVTVTPLAAVAILRGNRAEEAKDPYDTRFYRAYRSFLSFCLSRRKIVLATVAAMTLASFAGFTLVDKSFFPASSTPMFTVDFWTEQGTSLEATLDEARAMEEYLLSQPETETVASYAGEGALRFILTYTPGDPASNFGHLVVTARDSEAAEILKVKLADFVRASRPYLDPRIRSFAKGTGGGAKVQVRFLGKDPASLRRLADEAAAVFASDPDAVNIRNNWGRRTKVIRPELTDSVQLLGLSRLDVANALKMAFSGATAGLYREGEKLLPIVARLPRSERGSVESLEDTQIWSDLNRRYIPLSQFVSRISTVAEDSFIYRINRMKAITVECDSGMERPGALFERIRPHMEALELPSGVEMEWGGEYEGSRKAREGLMGMIPLGFLAIVIILVMLFNGFRQPLIILLCLPLSVMGLTVGLLTTGKSFDFMALLGFLSLAGMLIKNAIVLIDQIDLEMAGGKPALEAITDSGVSRARPVMMASLTTVLGMIPLYFDVLFTAMAVTIMFGLTFATVLILLVVPVLYGEALRA
ncbi:MAG: efflux RND transporter permease subunit [Aminivibrio sp.]|jgi:multidrug efflux pump subunit AcrB